MNTSTDSINGEAHAAAPIIEGDLDAKILHGQTLVVKYGGAAMGEEHVEELFADDVARLRSEGIRVVVVHGGGNDVTSLAAKLGIEAEFVNGHRRTSQAMLDVAVMMLAGGINKGLVAKLVSAGAAAIGLCGVDNRLLAARKLHGDVDLGAVGDVVDVNRALLDLLIDNGMVPVIAPIGIGTGGELYNINADLAAGAVAGALEADALIYMSNIEGIEVEGSVAREMTGDEAQALIARGAIRGGMIPKVDSAFAALRSGAKSVRIIDGREPHALMMAASGIPMGTRVVGE